MKTIIKLIVDGSVLEMGKTTINHTLNNPYLKDYGSYSLPFTIPLTDHNRGILGLSHDIHEYGYTKEFDAQLDIGLFSMKGVLEVQESGSGDYVKANLKSGSGQFFSKAEQVMITDLSHTDTIGSGYSLVNDSDWLDDISDYVEIYPTKNFVFAPIYMPEFPEDDITTIANVKVVNYWSVSDMKFVYKSMGASVYGNNYAPFYFVHKVIKEIFGYFGYTIETDEFYDNTELRQAVVFHMNHTDREPIETVSFAEHLPNVSCADFLRAMEEKFNLVFDVNEQSSIVNVRFRKNLLDETIAKDLTLQAEPKSVIDFDAYTGFSVEAGVDSDDKFVSDSDPDLDEANNDLFDFEEVNKDDAASPSEGDLLLETGTNKVYRYGFEYGVGYGWLDAGQAVSDYNGKAGDNNYFVKISCSHLLMHKHLSPVHEDLRMVARSDLSRYLQVISKVQPKLYNKVSILLYRGMIPYNAVATYSDLPSLGPGPLSDVRFYVMDEGKTYNYHDTGGGVYDWEDEGAGYGDYNQYPFLSSSRYLMLNGGDNALIPGLSVNLNMFGSDGMYVNFFEDWLYWHVYLRRVESRRIYFDHETFMGLRWDKKYRINNQNYFLSSVSFRVDFDNQRIEWGDSELASV